MNNWPAELEGMLKQLPACSDLQHTTGQVNSSCGNWTSHPMLCRFPVSVVYNWQLPVFLFRLTGWEKIIVAAGYTRTINNHTYFCLNFYQGVDQYCISLLLSCEKGGVCFELGSSAIEKSPLLLLALLEKKERAVFFLQTDLIPRLHMPLA